MEDVLEIRNVDRQEQLSRLEIKEYRKFTGELSWLAQGTRLHLSYTLSAISRKDNTVSIGDLHKVI